MKLDISRHARQFPADIESPPAEIEAPPILRQPLKAVETVDLATTDSAGDEADGAPGEYTELEVIPLDLHCCQSIGRQLALIFKAKRFRHGFSNVVDGTVERADRPFPSRMNKPDVGELVKCAYDLVKDVLHIEIGDEHG